MRVAIEAVIFAIKAEIKGGVAAAGDADMSRRSRLVAASHGEDNRVYQQCRRAYAYWLNRPRHLGMRQLRSSGIAMRRPA